MRRGAGVSKHGCGKEKPRSEFPEHTDWICNTCMTAYKNRENRDKAHKRWEHRLWAAYRLRPEQYDAMRKEQDYRCAICHAHEDEVDQHIFGRARLDGSEKYHRTTLVVDHCHLTNIVRRLLCPSCNQGLGHFGDDLARLETAVEYLRAHTALADEPPRSRVMPLDYVEVVNDHLCRKGLHPKVLGARTCKGCQADRQREYDSRRAAKRATPLLP